MRVQSVVVGVDRPLPSSSFTPTGPRHLTGRCCEIKVMAEDSHDTAGESIRVKDMLHDPYISVDVDVNV